MKGGFLATLTSLILASAERICFIEEFKTSLEVSNLYQYTSFVFARLLIQRRPNIQESKWVKSSVEKYAEGEWMVLENDHPGALEGDHSLRVLEDSKHHAISAPLWNPLDPSKGDVVIQYELRLPPLHHCGGSYIKVLFFFNNFGRMFA